MTTQLLADEAFGTDLFHGLATSAPDLVFSPASVAAALRMALLGARGETASELATALHIRTETETGPETGPAIADQAAAGLRQLDALVAGTPDDITFRVANTAWVQSGLPLLPDFTARLTASPSSTVAETDFAAAPQQARARINQAIEEQTAGKITNLLPASAVSALTRLVLANAVYLKAPWADPFPDNATKDAPFYRLPGQPVAVPMMRGAASRQYVRGDGYQAVLLPYRGSALAMTIVLPDGPLSGLATTTLATTTLATTTLGGVLDGAGWHRVTLSLPRFRVETQTDLTSALGGLGVRTAFGQDADFSGITTAEKLRISAAIHKAYVDVDEHGTEAAAATALVFRAAAMRKPPPPVEMVVDRPFLFAITDTASGIPLFLGHVTNPALPTQRYQPGVTNPALQPSGQDC
jgi:serpin B